MKLINLPIRVSAAIGLSLLLLSFLAAGVLAHETEPFVEWNLAYANVEFLGPPVYVYKGTEIVAVPDPRGLDPTIKMMTGDILIGKFSFKYVAPNPNRADIFYLTRLGLSFGILGKYVNGKFLGASSFEVKPGETYNVEIVLRALRPTGIVTRHLHIGVSLENIGNIPVAPKVTAPLGQRPIPRLYGVFTSIEGPVKEPLAGINIAPFGEVKLLETWPSTSASIVANIVIGFAFIGIMYVVGKRIK